MSRYTGPKHKLCRREGVKLCDSPKCPLARRNYPPGVHGPKGYPRLTPYGEQLREKQKAKRLYGVQERQFKNYFESAIKKRGNTGAFISQMLEKRLDNTVYRCGFATTRNQARQMVSHGFFTVNGKKVDIPSYQVQPKDVIAIKSNKVQSKLFTDLDKKFQKIELPGWLFLEAKSKSVKVVSDPLIEEASQIFNIQSIVEFYSR